MSRTTAARLLLVPALVATALATTVLTAPPAAAECRAERQYSVVPGGYWADYEALLVPASRGEVTKTITTTRTHSTTSEVNAQLEISVGMFISELNASVGASYQETATVDAGRSTTVTAPKSRHDQEIRFGTYMQKIEVELVYYGCPSGPVGDTTYSYAAREAAGAVRV